jgi:hypothetical protein
MPDVTPCELSLRSELEVEHRRFDSEWLFQWHKLNMPGHTVDVDRFDGGRITLGGILFGDQQQAVYWQAIERYLKGRVHWAFRRWDEEAKGYPNELRRSSLEGTGRIVSGFVAGIVARAIKTDQAVRGRGFPKTDKPRGSDESLVGARVEIDRLITAHQKLLAPHNEESQTLKKRLEKWYGENKAVVWIIGLVLAIAGIVARVFG